MAEPMAERKILHLDLDAFFCAVEEQRNPALVGKPFAVGGRPSERGVVASCSYPARRYGVRSAMPMGQALRLCPGLIVVPASHGIYRGVSRQVMERLERLTPLVEQVSIDEAFLDVSARPEPAAELARALQETIRRELGLPCSLGVASNKLVAKIANTVGKAAAGGSGPPNAVQVAPPGQEAAFLAPLPCEELPGVGPKTAARLHELGVATIGDLARWPAVELERLFGKNGADLALHARGLDDRPVVVEREAKSISKETTFDRDVGDAALLRRTVRDLAAGVSRRLRSSRLAGSTVKLKLRWSDFTTPTRQVTLAQATDDAEEIGRAALGLFERLWQPGRPVRLIGVGVSGLGQPLRQPTLWEVESDGYRRAEARLAAEAKLAEVAQRLAARYGEGALRRGSELPDNRPMADEE